MNSPQLPKQPDCLLNRQFDPEPVEIINPASTSPVLLVCEHAGRQVPQRLENLGLDEKELSWHIAHDIGAGQLARELAERLGCTLILQHYSRLVIDCNRPPRTPASIPPVSDGVSIPGNQGLDESDRTARILEIFDPYAAACKARMARPTVRYAFSIHSFTPVLGGVERPWNIGFLYRHAASRGDGLLQLAKSLWPEMTIGKNQPYSLDDETDWFIPVCAEQRQIPHSLIEIRNDHLATVEGRLAWGERLNTLLSRFMEIEDGTNT